MNKLEYKPLEAAKREWFNECLSRTGLSLAEWYEFNEEHEENGLLVYRASAPDPRETTYFVHGASKEETKVIGTFINFDGENVLSLIH